jgi:steroid delta-isomerase-like uncharacterized protein
LVPVSPEENKRRVLHYIEEIFNKGNLQATKEAWTEDIAFYSPIRDEPVVGIEELTKYVVDIRRSFEGFHFTVEEAVAERDVVALRVTHRGKHTGEWAGIPPTGKSVAIPETVFYRVRDGRVCESRLMVNAFDVMHQLGILPKGDLPKPLVWLLVRVGRVRERRAQRNEAKVGEQPS